MPKECLHPECDKRPSYGPVGGSPSHCKTHKEDGMVDVVHKRCQYIGCNKRPNFGHDGLSRNAIYCKIHKEDGMVDIMNKRCLHTGCNKQPHYGLKDGRSKDAIYCTIHKKDGMVDISHKKCIHTECTKIPIYGPVGGSRKDAVYCKTHKEVRMVDVVNEQCVVDGCDSQVHYGYLFKKKTHCCKHRLKNMYKKTRPRCITKGCNKRPHWTDDGTNFPLRCDDHRLSDDTNVIERPCKSCKLPYYLNEAGLCNDCYDYKYNEVRVKAKELRVKSLLEANNIVFTSWDKRIEHGCSSRRPDFVIDCDTFLIFLECDENQHGSIPCDCEQVRMIQLHQDAGMDVLFVRYNPDHYTDHTGTRVNENKSRESVLIDTLQRLITGQFSMDRLYLSSIHMFFNGWDGVPKIERIQYL